MRPELRNEMLRILEESSNGKPLFLHLGSDRLIVEAVNLLTEYGALEGSDSTSSHMITILGYDYYQKLKAPRVYWLWKNWFPVAVLISTSVVTVLVSALLD